MLHILGMILKIIGILLLILLGLILAIILMVLFVPIGYKLQGEKAAKEISGRASVYWLFHAIQVRIQYLDKKVNLEIYVFGIPILSLRRKLLDRKSTVVRKAAEEKKNDREKEVKTSAAVKTDKTAKSAKAEKEAGTEKPAEVKTETGTEKIAKAEKKVAAEKAVRTPDTGMQAAQEERPKDNLLVKIFKSINNRVISILQIPRKIVSRLQKIQLTIKKICDKIRRWKEFVTLDATKSALRFLLGRGRAILKHILPKRMKGHLTYGFDDPALTGQVLGALAVFYPVYRNRLQITPVFDHAILEGKVELKGRIYTVYLAVQALRILIHKDVKATYKRLQNKEA